MNVFSTQFNTLLFTSVAAPSGAAHAADILFYANLGLAFFGLISITVLTVLYIKTLYMRPLSLAGIITIAAGMVLYGVQLGMYAAGHPGTVYAVCVCTAVLYCGFIVCGAYFILLSRNSHRKLCIAAGALCVLPPIGAVAGIVLSYRIQRDTPIKKFVFSGYAYTYAALCSFGEKNVAEFIDMSGEEKREALSKKQIKRELKTLKKSAKTAEGRYNYAAALVGYTPYKFDKALKLMQRAADENYAPAQFNLGYYYEKGDYVKRDYKKARAYYERAAANGDKDAELRLAIIELESGAADAGLKRLGALSSSGELCAKYNLGVCQELGKGVPVDLEEAFEIYSECANVGMYSAQKRIFAAASTDMQSMQNGGLFRMITDRKFASGEFAAMIAGLIDIKKHLAADASEKFLHAIGFHGRWEGVARCLVGTLYIDCGKLPEDKRNGVEYIKSAFPLWSGAKDIYAALSGSVQHVGKSKK